MASQNDSEADEVTLVEEWKVFKGNFQNLEVRINRINMSKGVNQTNSLQTN